LDGLWVVCFWPCWRLTLWLVDYPIPFNLP
jgi:hypothetical protein